MALDLIRTASRMGSGLTIYPGSPDRFRHLGGQTWNSEDRRSGFPGFSCLFVARAQFLGGQVSPFTPVAPLLSGMFAGGPESRRPPIRLYGFSDLLVARPPANAGVRVRPFVLIRVNSWANFPLPPVTRRRSGPSRTPPPKAQRPTCGLDAAQEPLHVRVGPRVIEYQSGSLRLEDQPHAEP